MKAKKSLGQHFLKSEKAIAQIVEAGNISPSDTILEIGPGQGVLTQALLATGANVVAIEKDRQLIPVLQEKFANEIAAKKLQLIEADILKFDPNSIKGGYKLIANIPYYITGAIIEQFLSTSHQPEQMVLLIQKEVAERIVARDGKQSVLSIAISVYGTARVVAKVPAGAFNPPPKVDSVIISIATISRDFFSNPPAQADCDEQLFFSVLKSLFGKKRKQLRSSLADYMGDKSKAQHILKSVGVDVKARPETLTKEDWKKIVQTIAK